MDVKKTREELRATQQEDREQQMAELKDILRQGWEIYDDPVKILARYRDKDLADQVPRAIMYLDIGILAGHLSQQAEVTAAKQREALMLRWAEHTLKDLREAGMMVGVFTDGGPRPHEQEFALQIGYCLMTGKPLALVCPEGSKIPPRLEAAAVTLQYFEMGNEESFRAAMARAATEVAESGEMQD